DPARHRLELETLPRPPARVCDVVLRVDCHYRSVDGAIESILEIGRTLYLEGFLAGLHIPQLVPESISSWVLWIQRLHKNVDKVTASCRAGPGNVRVVPE